jgi:response regulator RpfG family c-di-GMP phosphodiesterase
MGRTLLYVDPDPATRLLVRKVLEPEGYTVLEAQTAHEGRESAQRARPDIILVDVDQVPPADLLTPLRQASGGERVAILASTARAWPDDHENAGNWGFERVLLKPLDIDRLAGDLSEYLPVPVPDPPADVLTVDDGDDRFGEPEAPRSEVSRGVVETEGPEVEASVADAGPEDLGPATEPSLPLLVERREVPLLWRINLTPVTESFVRAIPTTHGVVALLDETHTALTLVAAASLRPLAAEPAVGTRVPLPLVRWVFPVLESRQPAVLSTASLEDSPLVPGQSNVILIVPVVSGDRVHGVAILGEQRNPKFAPFAPAKISQAVGEARHIASVIDALRQLDSSVRLRREELHHARMEMVRSLLGAVKEHLRSRRSRRGEGARERLRRPGPATGALDPTIRLALEVAARLGVEPPQREPLRQALEAVDVGRAWLEELLFPRAGFSGEERLALLTTHGEYSAALLEALDWPAPTLALVRAHGAWWNGHGHPPGLAGPAIPLGARIMNVVTAYRAGSTSASEAEPPTPAAVVASLRREAGVRFDPAVVEALATIVAPSSD